MGLNESSMTEKVNIMMMEAEKMFYNYADIEMVDKDAKYPSKSSKSPGLNISIIKKHETLKYGAISYDTGLKISVDEGYFGLIIVKDSLFDVGLEPINQVILINNHPTQTLKIKIRHDPSYELKLPMKVANLIIAESKRAESISPSVSSDSL